MRIFVMAMFAVVTACAPAEKPIAHMSAKERCDKLVAMWLSETRDPATSIAAYQGAVAQNCLPPGSPPLPPGHPVYVRGHERDGREVEDHYRTAPNRTPLDNYSTRGNVNPWTGKPGTVN